MLKMFKTPGSVTCFVRYYGFEKNMASQCYLLPISYRHTTYFLAVFFLRLEKNMVLLQSMLSETCCENNRLMSSMNGKVKGMADAVTGLETGSVVEVWKKVVEPSDGFCRW